jgi:FkbM family methyltransferase
MSGSYRRRVLGLAQRSIAKIVSPSLRLPLYAAFYRLNEDREIEIDWVSELGDTSGIALDIGANYGLYTHELSRHYRSIHAFEPNPSMAANIENANLRNVQVHVNAISSQTGRATLYIPRSERAQMPGWASLNKAHLPNAAGFDEIEVACEPLDSFEMTGVSFIKIDVEGHELAALQGAQQTLAANEATLLVEVMQENRADARKILQHLGYAERSLESIVGIPGTPQNMIFMPVRN